MAQNKPRARERRATEELQRASLAVQYEFVTLAQTHQFLHELSADSASNTRDQALSNALLHAFLLAARSLLAFLFSHNARVSDIIAEDFFDNPEEWNRKRLVPETGLSDGDLSGLISKRLAHLTWDRADTSKPLWGAFKIAWNIGAVLQSFLQLVDEEKVHAQLREDVAIIMKSLETQAEYWGVLSEDMAPFSEFIEFDDTEYFGPARGPERSG